MENVSVKRHMGIKAKNRISNGIIYAILVIMSIVWLIPFVFILFESFRCESTWQVGYVIPKQWGFDNYINLFNKTKFLKWYGNTFITGLCCAVIQTIITLSMSYTLSRLRFKGRKLLMNLMLVLGMFPGFLSMILLYKGKEDKYEKHRKNHGKDRCPLQGQRLCIFVNTCLSQR